MCAILRMMDEESRKIERKRMTNGQRGREREREGKRGSRVRHRGREAPLIGRWHGRTLQSPWGYMNPGTALSLSLSLSLPPSLSLLLTLSHPPPHSLPSLRFYPTAKRRRVTWTQKRSIRASPTRPSLSFSHSLLFSILLSHTHSALSSSY